MIDVYNDPLFDKERVGRGKGANLSLSRCNGQALLYSKGLDITITYKVTNVTNI